MRTRSLAFCVASSGLLRCTQESWLRMLAISNRYLFRPALISVSWKSGSWVLGVQAATTTRLRFFCLTIWLIVSWVSWEQEYRLSLANSTYGRLLAYSATDGTSTTPAMLIPQRQTNTPIRGRSLVTFVSGTTSLTLVRVLRAEARISPAAAAAAALESTTDWGMSFGP